MGEASVPDAVRMLPRSHFGHSRSSDVVRIYSIPMIKRVVLDESNLRPSDILRIESSRCGVRSSHYF